MTRCQEHMCKRTLRDIIAEGKNGSFSVGQFIRPEFYVGRIKLCSKYKTRVVNNAQVSGEFI